MCCAFIRLFFWVLSIVPLTYVPAIISTTNNGEVTYENTRLFFMCLGANAMEGSTNSLTSLNWGSYVIQIFAFIVVSQFIIDALTVMYARRHGSCHTSKSNNKKTKSKNKK